MATHQNDFRGDRRGRVPPDWTARWRSNDWVIEGAACDLAHRNALSLVAPAVNGRRALSFNAPDVDAGHANQEVLIRVRDPVNDSPFLTVRGGGAAGTEAGYVWASYVGAAATQVLGRYVSGTFTSLATFSKAILAGAWYWARLRANSTTIQLRVWVDGDSEPGAWDASVTDSSHADGWLGLAGFYAGVPPTWVKYFAVGTNGATAPAESSLPRPMDQWCLDPDLELERTQEVEYLDTADNTVKRFFVSDIGRNTSATDSPPSTHMAPLLKDPGGYGVALSSDAQFGGAALPANMRPVILKNQPSPPATAGPLDALIGYSLAGRPTVCRIGPRWLTKPTPTSDGVLMPHRFFEIVHPAVVEREPDIGSEIVLQIVPPTRALGQTVPVRRNVGISTGAKILSATGYVTIPSHANYNVNSFTVATRVFVPAAGVAGSGSSVISRRWDNVANHYQWEVLLFQASHATDAHKLWLQASASDATALFTVVVSAKSYNLGRWIDVIFGVSGSQRWYWMVDGEVIASGTITKNPYNPTAAIVLGAGGTGLVVCDHRLDRFVDENTARSRFAALMAPDQLNLAMHRVNDNTGTVATDYNPNANHGGFNGTVNVDWQWEPTYLGSAEVAGTPQPLSEGAIFHAPTQPIDPVRELHRFNDRAITPGVTLNARAKGLALATPAAYSSPADGVIDIVGASDQPITFGQTAAATPSRSLQLPQLIKEVLVGRGALSPATADCDSFLALRSLFPYVGGVHYPTPPSVSELVGLLRHLGGHHRLDSSGRVAVGAMFPPVNPGPWGLEPYLEFMAFPNRGVTLGWHSSYALDQDALKLHQLYCVFKLLASPIDSSTSGTFTYYPTGQTLIDGAGTTATGYYLGIDGRDGCLIFGHPTITNTAGGLNYVKLNQLLPTNRWVAVLAYHAESGGVKNRGIAAYVLKDNQAGLYETLYATGNVNSTGTLATNTGVPIRVGHGPQGSFGGVIAQVVGIGNQTRVIPVVSGGTHVQKPVKNTGAGDKFFLMLDDGNGDVALEAVQSRNARIEGARWCPRLTFDYRRRAKKLEGVRRASPAWRVDARYRRNYAVLQGADVAAGVSASDRVAIQTESLSEPQTDHDTLGRYPLSQDVALDTKLYDTDPAKVVAAHMASRLAPGWLLADPKDWTRDAARLLPTDEILLYHPQYLASGRAMRVYSLMATLARMRFDVGGWG